MFTVQRFSDGSHKPDRSYPTKERAMKRLEQVGSGKVVDADGEVVASSYPYR